ncbi:MAG: anti-sigma factor antagonist [Mojavia pulchra JT2-VF2]|jgi:anti-anti-sigma factor|uniref:Anti-sigma factor antagonist n=1 Tax=Mojavia pulchra JT2-VF2 TaxID=287848 RepID=A0A951UG67_9NOST|nr:anti-sigma factor antagonist [Mojavia pulchra JT2-VF2]
MAFSATLEIAGDTAKITLTGELDASSAPIFRVEVENAAKAGVKRLVLLLQDLEYISSAGLRVLIFAKQKMGANADIYVVAAQEMVVDTLEKTGFSESVIMVDEYDAA